MKVFKIYARFDEKSNVWYVEKSNVPGLRAEAETQEELLEELKILIPALLQANNVDVEGDKQAHKSVPIELIAQRREHVVVAC